MADMSYHMFLQILIEAEERVKNAPDDTVRANSQETVDLCLERMRRDGITRETIEQDVRGAVSDIEALARIKRAEIRIEEIGGVPMWVKIKEHEWTAPLNPIEAARYLWGMRALD